jgi:S-adenosyl-L-homocysteine hydrolase
VTSSFEWVRGRCLLLARIAGEFRRTRPFDGMTIGTGIHLEPKTAALLLTLAQGGASVISTGNLSSTQADVVAYLRRNGIEVIGEAATDQAEHETHLKQVLAARPDILLDNGGDLFVTDLTEPYAGTLVLYLSLHAVHHTAGTLSLTPGLAVFGIGMGMIFVPLFSIIISEISDHEVGSASGLLESSQQLGASLGVAVLATLFFSTISLEKSGPQAAMAAGRSLLAAERTLLVTLVMILVAFAPAGCCHAGPAKSTEPAGKRQGPAATAAGSRTRRTIRAAHAAFAHTGMRPAELRIDRAYLSSALARDRGSDLGDLPRPWRVRSTADRHAKGQFTIDLGTRSLTCPAETRSLDAKGCRVT